MSVGHLSRNRRNRLPLRRDTHPRRGAKTDRSERKRRTKRHRDRERKNPERHRETKRRGREKERQRDAPERLRTKG